MKLIKHQIPWVVLCSSGLVGYACGGTTPPPSQPDDSLTLVTPSATAPTTTAAPATPPAASSAPPAASSSEKKPPRQSSGSPMVVSEGEKEITSAFSPQGGIIRIGGAAELTITRGALNDTFGVTFALNTGSTQLKITPYKGQIGDVYRLFIFRESASNTGVGVSSVGGPFLLKLPLKGAKTANLAVATSPDGKVAKYTITAPKNIEEADGGGRAVFELMDLPGEAILHLTNAPPTAK